MNLRDGRLRSIDAHELLDTDIISSKNLGDLMITEPLRIMPNGHIRVMVLNNDGFYFAIRIAPDTTLIVIR